MVPASYSQCAETIYHVCMVYEYMCMHVRFILGREIYVDAVQISNLKKEIMLIWNVCI